MQTVIAISVGNQGLEYRGAGPVSIGRDPECDLHIDDDAQVSRLHLVVRHDGHDWVAIDQESSNGTFLNETDQRVTRAILRDGDRLRLGSTTLTISVEETREEVAPDAGDDRLRFQIVHPEPLAREVVCQREAITIGRHASCDVFLDHPTVSRLHATVVRRGNGYVISDRNATNAVYLGDPPKPVTTALLFDGQTVRLGEVVLRVVLPVDAPHRPEPTRVLPAASAADLGGPRPPGEVVQARLAETPLFQGFEEDDWAMFLACYEREEEIRIDSFAAGAVICEAGRYDLFFRVVIDGTVQARDPDTNDVLAEYANGGFFGGVEAKRALPRPTRHVAATAAHVLRIPRHQIRLVERNALSRALLAESHKEQSWRVIASQLGLFRGVSLERILGLVADSELVFHDKAGIVLAHQGEPGEFMGIVRDGYVKVVEEREGRPERTQAYLRRGDVFGEVALLTHGPHQANVVTAGRCEVVKIPRDAFLALCRDQPVVQQRLEALDKSRRAYREEQLDTEFGNRLEKWGQGYIQADALLVMDLERCVKCDLCVEACEQLHGESRLQRRGIELGHYLAPSACRHCDDPVCMTGCPEGAIKREDSGEIFIDYDSCTGVGACAIACPYDNIQMIETERFDRAQARKKRLHGGDFFRPHPERRDERGFVQRWLGIGAAPDAAEATAQAGGAGTAKVVPPRYPIKCDLCAGLPIMGCVHACPTGAAQRVDPTTILGGAVSSGSNVRKAKRAGEG